MKTPELQVVQLEKQMMVVTRMRQTMMIAMGQMGPPGVGREELDALWAEVEANAAAFLASQTVQDGRLLDLENEPPIPAGVLTLDMYRVRQALTGAKNGTNTAFSLASVPVPGTEMLFKNGLLLEATGDYTISGAAVTFLTAPVLTDKLTSTYIHLEDLPPPPPPPSGGPSSPQAFFVEGSVANFDMSISTGDSSGGVTVTGSVADFVM